MTTKEVADKIIKFCNEAKFEEALSLYSRDIVSIEAAPQPPGQSRESKGIEAVKAKVEWWSTNHEVHSFSAEGPLVAGEYFAATFKMDVTLKSKNQRYTMEEVAVYKVVDGKVVHEEFFYSM